MTTDKMRERAEARRWRETIAGKVVFTNGVFDLLHPGHVALLEQARGQGDALIVGVNSDRSARHLSKGTGRPIVPAADRARLVAALEAVDCVVVFDEDTPETLIGTLEPDLLIKGGDYPLDTIPGREQVLARGGEVSVIPVLEGYSTTRLVERINAAS